MTGFRHVAVIDVGKTNAKLALVDVEKMEEIAVERRPNRVLYSTPWPHFDLDGLWDFFSSGLTHLHRAHGIDAISVTTHGASGVLLDASGRVAAPMLDYEHTGPDGLRRNYDRARPPFSETGAPRLGGGLNLGAQFYWQFVTDPGLKDRTTHVVTYPQYWGFRLTGQIACDVCSLGCHTDLWNPWSGKFSTLVERLGLSAKMAPPMRPDETLGPVTPGIANRLCLTRGTLVSVGIHDSNASLLPYLTSRTSPFAVVSTGTWVIAMAIGGAKVTLKPERDTLVNVNAFGHPVPSARFMGGREYEEIVKGSTAIPSAADRSGVHPAATFNQPVVLEKFWDQEWDAAVVFCRQADRPGEDHQRRAARTLGARWHELDTGHYPMLSMPDALTRIILEG